MGANGRGNVEYTSSASGQQYIIDLGAGEQVNRLNGARQSVRRAESLAFMAERVGEWLQDCWAETDDSSDVPGSEAGQLTIRECLLRHLVAIDHPDVCAMLVCGILRLCLAHRNLLPEGQLQRAGL